MTVLLALAGTAAAVRMGGRLALEAPGDLSQRAVAFEDADGVTSEDERTHRFYLFKSPTTISEKVGITSLLQLRTIEVLVPDVHTNLNKLCFKHLLSYR